MRSSVRVVLAFTGLCALAVGQSAKVVFVATNEGQFAEFGDPCLSRAGWVVFHATRDDRREGIYVSAGSVPKPVAESGGVVPDGKQQWHFQAFGRQPSVNNNCSCAFIARFTEGGSAVLLSDGAQGLKFIADSGEAFREFGDFAAVNADRQVAFRATIDPANHPDRKDYDPRKLDDPTQAEHPERIPAPKRMTFDGRKEAFHEGLFVSRASDLLTIGTTEKELFALPDGFAFNDTGAVAFRASKREKSWSVLFVPGGAAAGATVVLAETGPQFQSFELPAIDSRGHVAFVAHTADGVGAICRATQAGGRPEIIADAQSGFVGFGPDVALDDTGRIAFVARRADGHEALFVASSYTDAKELIAVGDAAGRSTLKHLRLGNRAFGRSDRIALLVQLESGVEAVVVLHLEPGR